MKPATNHNRDESFPHNRREQPHEVHRRSTTNAGQGGFTLIELLVVIAILGILAGVVVFSVGGLTNERQESACKIDKRTIETAVEAAVAEPEDPAAERG